MSYLATVSEVRAAAQAVNGDRFDHGVRVDFSRGFDNNWPFIWLYPFEIVDPIPGANQLLDSATVRMGFWQQDRPDTSTAEREIIIGQMDALCTAFLNQLMSNKMIGVSGIRREPQYKFHQGHVSGMAVQFTLQTPSECIDE